MDFKRRKLLGGFNRYRLILTLGLAVLLPAALLIFVNFQQLWDFQHDKVLEAAIHRDFQEWLALTEKKMNKKAYAKVEEARQMFPSPDLEQGEIDERLEKVLEHCSCFTHAFLFNGDEWSFMTQPGLADDRYVHDEHERLNKMFREWFSSGMEVKSVMEGLQKKNQHIIFTPSSTKRSDGPAYQNIALFLVPNVAEDRIVIGGLAFDPCYLKSNFFSGVLDEQVSMRSSEQGGNPVAMMLYPTDYDTDHDPKPISVTAGWGDGKPEAMRKMDDVFRGLTLGIKFQKTSVEAIGQNFVRRSFILLCILSLLIVGGLILTKRVVSKEMALARLKSDFVSNVSHELRTPLALIRLYAETLELGRITTREKKEQYYRIIRKESERLTALINNILDFSRIEAGHKEYEFRETDIGDLVHNTLDSYRYQIEQQGFAFEEKIADNLPPVIVDREAIARAVVNLVNNALKYSAEDKFLGVRLYRDNGSVKLEVIDHGIGIDRRDQAKIFEKFYRTGDPLVHNTKGSGLGLSLVRHITEAHGGAIEVDSTPGKGSRFVLSLPLNGNPQPALNHAI